MSLTRRLYSDHNNEVDLALVKGTSSVVTAFHSDYVCCHVPGLDLSVLIWSRCRCVEGLCLFARFPICPCHSTTDDIP